MNKLAESINSFLTDEKLLTQVDALQKNNPNHSPSIHNVPISIETSTKQFHYSKNILLQAIDNGIFETLPAILQDEIASHIKKILNNQNNIHHFMTYQQQLYHSIFTAGLEFRLSEDFNQYQDILSKLSNASLLYDKIEKFNEFFKIEKIENKANTILENSEQSEKQSHQTTDILKNIKSYEQEIENTKKMSLLFKIILIATKRILTMKQKKQKQ